MYGLGHRSARLFVALVLASSVLWVPPTRGSDHDALLQPEVAIASEAPAATQTTDETETVVPTLTAEPTATVLTLVSPAVCEARASVTVTATLTDASGTPLPDRTVIVERLGRLVVALGSRLTDASGRVMLTIKPTARMNMRARYEGDEGYAGSTSDTATVKPKVSLSVPWTHDSFAYPDQRVPARGRLWPRHSKTSTSTVLVCERYEDGKWVARATFRARITNKKTYSKYAGVVRFPKSGLWRVRARHGDYRHARTYGPAQKVRVTNWPKRYVGKKNTGIKTSKRAVAITIDDGPNSRTPDICAILERYGGRGTFFFTSQLLARGYGDQAKRTYERGHEIANHTANHKMLTGSYSTSYRQAIVPKRAIKRYTGFSPIWIRAMGGGIDSTGMRAVVDSGQLYCNWSIDSYDSHRSYTPPSVLYHTVMRSVKPGSVILIHQTHPETIKALPAICRELKRRGYSMVTLSRLAAYGEPR